jgi:curved DNA-binding protein CbpA
MSFETRGQEIFAKCGCPSKVRSMPFATLGLTERASVDEVKLAYRKLAKIHHPDVNPDDPTSEERFKAITSAYTQALLASSRRASEAESVRGGASSSSSSSASAARMRGSASPRAAYGQKVDGSRYNVRDWEYHHYGMHGGTEQKHHADERVRATFVHNMARQRQRDAQSAARQARQASGGSRGGPTSALSLALSIAACATIWMSVGNTVNARFRTSR